MVGNIVVGNSLPYGVDLRYSTYCSGQVDVSVSPSVVAIIRPIRHGLWREGDIVGVKSERQGLRPLIRSRNTRIYPSLSSGDLDAFGHIVERDHLRGLTYRITDRQTRRDIISATAPYKNRIGTYNTVRTIVCDRFRQLNHFVLGSDDMFRFRQDNCGIGVYFQVAHLIMVLNNVLVVESDNVQLGIRRQREGLLRPIRCEVHNNPAVIGHLVGFISDCGSRFGHHIVTFTVLGDRRKEFCAGIAF